MPLCLSLCATAACHGKKKKEKRDLEEAAQLRKREALAVVGAADAAATPITELHSSEREQK